MRQVLLPGQSPHSATWRRSIRFASLWAFIRPAGVTSVAPSGIDTLILEFGLAPVGEVGPPLSFNDVFMTKAVASWKCSRRRVLAGNVGPNQATLSATLATPPSHGQLRLRTDSGFSTTGSGFVGVDLFQYRSIGEFDRLLWLPSMSGSIRR
jgi:hypothetical protein